MRYQISQRVIKASESLFNAVTCCSGPFAAYRRQSVLRNDDVTLIVVDVEAPAGPDERAPKDRSDAP